MITDWCAMIDMLSAATPGPMYGVIVGMAAVQHNNCGNGVPVTEKIMIVRGPDGQLGWNWVPAQRFELCRIGDDTSTSDYWRSRR